MEPKGSVKGRLPGRSLVLDPSNPVATQGGVERGGSSRLLDWAQSSAVIIYNFSLASIFNTLLRVEH